MPCICPPSIRAISGFVSLLPWVTFHEVSICCAGLFWIRMNIASGRNHTIQSNRSVDFLLYVTSTRHREPGILLMKQAWLGPVKHWQLADLLEINIFKMFRFVSFKSHSIIAFRWQSLTPIDRRAHFLYVNPEVKTDFVNPHGRFTTSMDCSRLPSQKWQPVNQKRQLLIFYVAFVMRRSTHMPIYVCTFLITARI